MKKTYFSMLAAVALTAGSAAQSAPAPSNGRQSQAPAQESVIPDHGANQFPAGTMIAAELSKSVDARKAKTGDKIEARIPADVLLHGKVVIPRNAKLIGQVTDVKAHSKESPDSSVGIAFDRIAMKDGRELAIQVTVQAIARPLANAALASGASSEDASMPSGAARPAGGVAMGRSMPSRSPERVASIPPNDDSGRDAGSSDRETLAPLGPTSKGVVGMKGLSLNAAGQASVISSQTDNVHLDSGTQLILRTR